jgi:hypothetical protein
MTSSALAINPSLYRNLGYDAVKDFAPVTLATLIPFILVVHTSLPARSVKELIGLARSKPGELAYSSAGTGNATHLSMALFEMMAKIKMNHVPYKGTGQALSDAMGGHVQLMFGAIPSTMPGVKAGKLRIGGGATRSALWNQIQADVYGRPVETLRASESTGLGAALLGGLGAGLFNSLQQGVEAMVHVADQIEPDLARHARYEELYQAYVQAYEGLSSSGTFDTLSRIQATGD